MNLILPKQDYVSLGYWENKNIYRYLKEAAEEYPEKIAVVDQSRRYTYQELNENVKKVAGAFRASGIKRGDVVSYQLPNWVECVILHQALAMIGAISNPIIPIYRQKEVKYILNQSNSKMFFIPSSFRNSNYLDTIRTIRDEIPSLEKIIVVDKYNEKPILNPTHEVDYSTFIKTGFPVEDIEPVNETMISLLLYTSGTTSEPKGVLHTHNTLLHENRTILEMYELGSNDVIFMPSPVTHITGLLYGCELPFMIKGRVVLQDIFEPEEAVRYLINEEVTWTCGATPFLKGIVETISSEDRLKLKLKAFSCGGADVPPELIKEGSNVLKCCVTRVYGSSEYPTFLACGYQDTLDKAAHTDGKKFKGSYGKIIDLDGKELPAGVTGELAVKGPEMFLGYVQQEFSKDTFLDDGYFLTGDLAVMDEDGYIEIKGRKKDIIIRGGENISVKEIEEILYEHPKIANVAIVAMPDERMGEKACAYVVLKGGESFTFEEMIQFITKKGVAKQKLPERLEIIDQMPMTASGKIQKVVLREDIRKKINV